ncbi:hypothetical protein NDU88_001970 [Pleurodeles waltl]|uniref:Uncharacterized protein n=1 Tax=Pleurodeles waltl TaxID=8319 RepID=A0AAV7RAM7_PLEWA|nr:hypothetical protein NDU88_001970 [Pleurodeles waltl]
MATGTAGSVLQNPYLPNAKPQASTYEVCPEEEAVDAVGMDGLATPSGTGLTDEEDKRTNGALSKPGQSTESPPVYGSPSEPHKGEEGWVENNKVDLWAREKSVHPLSSS